MGNLLSSFTRLEPSRGTLAEAEGHRRKAHELAERQHALSAQSQAAYKSGNGAAAKSLSIQARALHRQVEEHNRQAAALYLYANNVNNPPGVLDLHGLFVKEALQAVQEEVRKAKKERRGQLVLIVGAGHHSRDGVQRIRPAVEKMMRDAGHRYEAINQGCLKVYLKEPPELITAIRTGTAAYNAVLTGVQYLEAGAALLPKPSVKGELAAFQSQSNANFCAQELTLKLADAFKADDRFSQRSFPLGAGNWRNPDSRSWLGLTVGCNVKKAAKRTALIVCKGKVGDGRAGVFARYFAYFPEVSDPQGKGLAEYEAKAAELLNPFSTGEACFRGVFEAAGSGARLISPFHARPFDVLFRAGGSHQSVCKLVLDLKRYPVEGVAEPVNAIERLGLEYSVLFHRLASDIYTKLPSACTGLLPVINPPPEYDHGNARRHLNSVATFLAYANDGRHRHAFEVLNQWSSETQAPADGETLLSRLHNRVHHCALKGDPLLFSQCHFGLPNWVGTSRCPPTSLCYDNDRICGRILACGDGLWMQVRGQSSVENKGRFVKSWTPLPSMVIDSLSGYIPPNQLDPMTQAYYQFGIEKRSEGDTDGAGGHWQRPEPALEREGILVQKLHFASQATGGVFMIIFYDPSKDSANVTTTEAEADMASLVQPAVAPRHHHPPTTQPQQPMQSQHQSTQPSMHQQPHHQAVPNQQYQSMATAILQGKEASPAKKESAVRKESAKKEVKKKETKGSPYLAAPSNAVKTESSRRLSAHSSIPSTKRAAVKEEELKQSPITPNGTPSKKKKKQEKEAEEDLSSLRLTSSESDDDDDHLRDIPEADNWTEISVPVVHVPPPKPAPKILNIGEANPDRTQLARVYQYDDGRRVLIHSDTPCTPPDFWTPPSASIASSSASSSEAESGVKSDVESIACGADDGLSEVSADSDIPPYPQLDEDPTDYVV